MKPARRLAPLASLALLIAAGCDEDIGQPEPRPPIEITDARCTASELIGLGRASRFVPMDEGRFAIWGIGDRYRATDSRPPESRLVFFDLAGREPRTDLWSDDRYFCASTWHQGALYMAYRDSHVAQLSPDGTSVAHATVGAPVLCTAEDLHITDNLDVIYAFSSPSILRRSAIARIGRDDSGFVQRWFGGLATPDDNQLFAGTFRSFVVPGDGTVVAAGVSTGVFEGERISFIEIINIETGASLARELTTQSDIEPMRLLLDHQGRPTLLALEGHSGARYERGQPFIARVGPDARLYDRRDIDLPSDAAHGAVLAAIPLDDGWLFGGSVCSRGRSWCDAFIQRVVGDEVAWTRRLQRSVAATVSDLLLHDGRVFGTVSSSRYCCEYQSFDHDAWLWEVEVATGECAVEPVLERDGQFLR
jgi:hypothetical protein